ncbi:MAG: diguanylate cyclase [Chloroflexota bacterium]
MTTMLKGNILIVDDMAENLKLLMRILESHGYRVEVADNGLEAVVLAQAHLPDLILMDVNMPDLDGFGTCLRLKEDERTRDIPVIFISALDAVEDKVRAFNTGGVDYITKPIQIEEMMARVETHMTLQRLSLQLQTTNQRLEAHIHELTHSQEQLHERESRLSAFINALPSLLYIFDEQGHYLEILTDNVGMIGEIPDDIQGRSVRDVLPGSVAELMISAIQRAIATGQTQTIEYKIPIPDGGERWFEGRIAKIEKDDSTQDQVVLLAADITERTQLYQEVQRLATLDPLTGCYNRRYFHVVADQELQRAIRYHRPFALFILDIDHFKRLNDTYGHPVGDKVLCALVELCQQKLRSTDIIGRYGGDEFVILMPELDAQGALQAGERLRKLIEEFRVTTTAGDISLTVSIGVASVNAEGENPDSIDPLMNRADEALYAVKSSNRNSIKLWQDGE